MNSDISDISGEWDVTIVDKGRASYVGRVAFLMHDGRLVVKDADPESNPRPARVDVDGETARFELLSAGSSRGSTHHVYEIRMQGPDAFVGTRRRGMLARVPVSGKRAEPAVLAPADAAVLLAEAEAEVAAALEVARRAAERAAAARAVVPSAELSAQPVVAPAVLARLPAPSAPPALVPAAVPAAAEAAPTAEVLEPGVRLLPIGHRLTRGDITVFAAEIFPEVYVWGGSFAAADLRLREAGWVIVEVDTGETTEVDEALLRHAATIRDSAVA